MATQSYGHIDHPVMPCYTIILADDNIEMHAPDRTCINAKLIQLYQVSKLVLVVYEMNRRY